MPIRTRCPNAACNRVLTAPDPYAGQRRRCPHCGTPVLFPSAAVTAAPPLQAIPFSPPPAAARPGALARAALLGGAGCAALLAAAALPRWHAGAGLSEFPALFALGLLAAALAGAAAGLGRLVWPAALAAAAAGTFAAC